MLRRVLLLYQLVALLAVFLLPRLLLQCGESSNHFLYFGFVVAVSRSHDQVVIGALVGRIGFQNQTALFDRETILAAPYI